MFRVNPVTAELVGIILGDGNIFVKDDHYELTITLHAKEKEYADLISKMIKETFFEEVRFRYRIHKNAFDIKVSKKRFVKELSLLGLRAGSKIKNNSGIPKWIFSSRTFVKSCLRGLFDTDGSVYRLTPNWPNLIQVSFKNNNRKLLSDVRISLVSLGFKPSKIFGNRLVITRKSEVEKYFKEIGTNNLRYSPVV